MKNIDDVLFANGKRLGKSEGHAEGKVEGIAETQLKTAIKLLHKGTMPHEEIADLVELPLEKVKELAAQTAV